LEPLVAALALEPFEKALQAIARMFWPLLVILLSVPAEVVSEEASSGAGAPQPFAVQTSPATHRQPETPQNPEATASPIVSAECGPAARQGREAPPSVRRLLQSVEKEIAAGRFDEAARELEKHRREQPEQEHGLLEFQLGNALYLAGKKEACLAPYERAVALEPCYGPAWVNLGQVALELGRYGRAAEALSRGTLLIPEKTPELVYYEALALLLNREPARAVPLLERLAGGEYGSPRPAWFEALLQACVELGRQGEAAATLRRMTAAYGEDPQTWKLYSRFEINRRNYPMAAVALTIYGYLTELTREEQVLLADLYAAAHAPALACELYEKAEVWGELTPSEHEKLASACLAAHQPGKARRILDPALARQPTPRLWSLQGDLLFREKDYEGAFRAFEECFKLDSGSGRPLVMMARCSLELGRREEAAALLRRAAGFEGQKKEAGTLLRRLAGSGAEAPVPR